MPLEHPSDTRALLQLLRAEGVGAQRAGKLLKAQGSASRALAAGPSAWREAGLDSKSIQSLQTPDQSRLDADLAWLDGADNRHLISCIDADFPALLAGAPNPPAALFVRGDPDLLWSSQIAVVGSRNPTAGGRDNASAFTTALVEAGLTITSGLAEGVDAAAHRAALDRGGKTIAVMGTGPDRVYPAGHRRLAEQIAEQGALVTEFLPDTGAKRDHFPRRNRIVVGLALGTLVIEAALQSGALISARLAAEAGREVFALPGSIHNPLARGCHRLIREGAALIETADEVIAAVAATGRLLGQHLRERLQRSASPERSTAVDPAYEQLVAALGHDPIGMDQLVSRTGLTVDALSSMLLVLELDGRVAAFNGRYARRGG